MGVVQIQEVQRKSAFRQAGVPALIVLIGIAILLYPIASTLWNNGVQRQVAEAYSQFAEELDPTERNDALEAAHEYNRTRTIGPILDPWTARLSEDNEPYKAYLEHLNLSDVMARIVIPAINVDLPVYHGTRPHVLERGVGHLFGTDLPVGGSGTHSVLTAHTGLQTATLFDNLADLKEGDSIYIDVYGEKLSYVVVGTEVVLPEETESLYKEKGRDLLTLVTCTPYGVNSHRLLVHAERALMDEAAEAEIEQTGMAIQWWMWLFAAGALITLVLLVRFLVNGGKRMLRKNETR
ncbi:sortase A [Trueperella bonasi]|uniref:Sortase A n=1 Tax=Trueperella bonasi TaxID=312286 RepID=A0ABT9NED2_9ACTO|nr:class C sortase [Trueperella bonasi]MDP9805744.1 sortase A [Trueperella bonasi]